MNGWFPRILACAMVALAIPPAAARAQEAGANAVAEGGGDAQRRIVIYRCTDAAGGVTIQNDVACPKGTTQQRQAIDAPTPMPAYVPREERMPEVVAAERADEAAAIAAAVRPATPEDAKAAARGAGAAPAKPGPPPALYACRAWDQSESLTEDAAPVERCAPLQVVGVDGVARADATACEKVADQCAAVPPESLCQAWRRRVDEAEFRWKFAGAKQDDARRREYELLRATLAHSDCPP
jgi:hypothetical protein